VSEFEQRVSNLLHARAAQTNVTFDLDEIKQDTPIKRERRQHRLLLVAAATVLVIAAGLIGLAAIRGNESDESAPATAANDLEPASPYGALPHTGPTTSEHWHMSYQFDICGVSRQLSGNLEGVGADGQPLYPKFVATGVHSHDDGVIHAHPFTDSGAGVNLTLSTFLDNYDVQLTDTMLSFPEAQGGGFYDEATAQCDGKPAQLVIVVWPDPHRPDDKIIVTDQLGGLPLSVDGMAITIALTADPEAVPLPPIVDKPQID
jgi:hypothetical protein